MENHILKKIKRTIKPSHSIGQTERNKYIVNKFNKTIEKGIISQRRYRSHSSNTREDKPIRIYSIIIMHITF